MKIGQVIGTVVSSAKDESLAGKKILVVQPTDREGRHVGRSLIALDSVGAGVGEAVYYVRGKEGSFPWFPDEIPCDCAIVGILDPCNFEEREPPCKSDASSMK